MQPISQTEINSKISKSLLDRGQRRLMPAQQLRIADLVGQFHRAVDLQNRRDRETMASLTRMLCTPRSAQAEKFVTLLRGLLREELNNKGNL